MGFGKVSKKEKQTVIPLIKNLLNHRSGKDCFFSNSNIRDILLQFGFEVKDSEVRKYIFYLRNSDEVELLIANNNGYYIANDTTDVKGWIAMQEGKILAMKESLESIKRQYAGAYKKLAEGDESVDLRGQLDIWSEVE